MSLNTVTVRQDKKIYGFIRQVLSMGSESFKEWYEIINHKRVLPETFNDFLVVKLAVDSRVEVNQRSNNVFRSISRMFSILKCTKSNNLQTLCNSYYKTFSGDKCSVNIFRSFSNKVNI